MLNSFPVYPSWINPSLEKNIGVRLSEMTGHMLLCVVTGTQSSDPLDTSGRMRGKIVLNFRMDSESCLSLESDGKL